MKARVIDLGQCYAHYDTMAEHLGVLDRWWPGSGDLRIGMLGDVVTKGYHLKEPNVMIYAIARVDGSIFLIGSEGIELLLDFEEVYNALT